MELEQEFREEFIKKYSEKEYEEIGRLLDEMWGYDTDKIDQTFTKWNLSLEKEKHHQLQYTYYINLSKEGIDYDEEVNLEYENGIDTGTVLREYSLDGGGGIPAFREVEVLKDIEPDWDKIRIFVNKGNKISEIQRNRIMQIFDYHKDDILKGLHNQNYDDYVTGGGTAKTDKHYKDKRLQLEARGFYYKTIYETVQADVNLV